jgi:tRNA threonylcarbamoyladenosine biosynthesis protein TsaB
VRVLAIETSGRIGSVALLEAAGGSTSTLALRRLPAEQRTARSLLPAISELLAERAWRPADVELVCAATGPGSFTGLRIGVVAAKTFAYATGALLAGVHTLAAMAEGVGRRDAPLWTVLDAQRQELFAARFAPKQSVVEQFEPRTMILPVAEWLAQVAAGDAVAGPPLAKLRQQLPPGAMLVEDAMAAPDAAAVGRLGAALAALGRTVEPMELVPHYFRQSAAEEKAAR